MAAGDQICLNELGLCETAFWDGAWTGSLGNGAEFHKVAGPTEPFSAITADLSTEPWQEVRQHTRGRCRRQHTRSLRPHQRVITHVHTRKLKYFVGLSPLIPRLQDGRHSPIDKRGSGSHSVL